MPSQPTGTPTTHLLSAAQYLRMSTKHQQYSIANQSAAIALYAAAHNIGIVRSFADEGKSGTTIKGRTALQELLRTVESATADFDLILVYDVSRWGRFPDSDEAAHYEFLCKKPGIGVHYCAEQFENDNSTTSNLLKALKRTMAGEFSRELGAKVSAGQRRIASLGWKNGGPAPFGYVRQLVDKDGRRKQILRPGERKSIPTDRVTLWPGPRKAVATIKLAFGLFTQETKNYQEISDYLNSRGLLFDGRAWNNRILGSVLRNPVYKGDNVFGKIEHKGAGIHGKNPQEKWIVREGAFPGIVSPERFSRSARNSIRSGLLSGRLSAGPPMSCAQRNRYGPGWRSESPPKRARSRSSLRWTRRLNQSGRKRRPVFTSRYSRGTQKMGSVSMLVRLDPGTDYPAHRHAGIEELHLLHGILKVDERTLHPGDFIHSDAGSVDHRVWSETGCTCFLLTSAEDVLF